MRSWRPSTRVCPSPASLVALEIERRRRAKARASLAAEQDTCRTDPAAFVNQHCRIAADDGSGLIPFHLYDYQAALLRDFLAHQEIIILKARQLGITELVAAYALWRALTPHTTILVISQGEAEATEFLRRVRLIWTNLPPAIQPAVKDPRRSSTLELANESRIIPFPATGRAGRSFTAQLLILDEWAQQEHQEAIYAAASPIIKSSGGQIVGISTAAGAGNFYHRQWTLARAGQGMHPVFLPWHVRPGRDADWYETATRTYPDWLRAQEFPATEGEAFALSGRPRFDLPSLDAIERTCRPPLEERPIGLDASGRAVGSLRIWADPAPGRRYVCGADTAEGLPRGDYSAAIILDWETGTEVAELHGHWDPGTYARQLATLCRRYNTAQLAVERNNHGHAVLLALTSVEGYEPLYRHHEYDATTGQWEAAKAGWQTSTKSKPIMIDALAAAIAERRPYANAAFVAEARTYCIGDKGDTAASGNLHDDRVVAYAIAEQLRREPQGFEYAAGDTFSLPAGYRLEG